MRKTTFTILLLLIAVWLHGQEVKKTNNKKTIPKPAAQSNGKAKNNDLPVTPLDYVRRGSEFRALNNVPAALDDFNKALELDPNYYRAYILRGEMKFVMQDFQNALQDFNKAIDIAQQLIDAAVKRGNVKLILEDHRGATQEFNTANDLMPFLGEALYNRGNVKYFLNDSEGCCMDLGKAAELGYLQSYNYIKKYCQNGSSPADTINRK
ncbi:MAG: hypothetical protein HYY40_04640 [Bacteroidetes bacterium]|nr:hypothetical protein [Bacteroidota bacterium]